MQPQTPISPSSFASRPKVMANLFKGNVAPKVTFGTIFCTPLQHFSPNIALSCGTPAKREGRQCRRPTRKRYFWRQGLEGSATNSLLTSKIIKNRLWALWGSFGVVWGSLGRLWGDFGNLWGDFGRLLEDSGRLWGGFGETLGGFGKALGRRSDRPSDRPTDYIFKLPINRTCGIILVVRSK